MVESTEMEQLRIWNGSFGFPPKVEYVRAVSPTYRTSSYGVLSWYKAVVRGLNGMGRILMLDQLQWECLVGSQVMVGSVCEGDG